MKYNIQFTPTTKSKIGDLDFDNILFGRVFSDHMFEADFIDGQWTNIAIKPFGSFSLHPATLALHYGQSIFEGMKATKHQDGTPLLMRPEEHARRLNASADRLCMERVPEELFLQAVHSLVNIEKDWIPPAKGSALYLRPFLFATDEMIGVRASDNYKFIIFACPVGPYYPKPISLLADTFHVRAVEGGVGEAKACGNYAASLLPAKMAKESGYDQVLWLDGKESKYVQEVGTMNIFFVIDNVIITPSLDGAILRGITRKSIIEILKENGHTIEERPLSIDEILLAHKDGTLSEVFGTGTAAVVAQVNRIKINDTIIDLDVKNAVVSKFAKGQIDGLRDGTVEDTRGWIISAKESLTAEV